MRDNFKPITAIQASLLAAFLGLVIPSGLHAQVQVPAVLSYQGRISKLGTNQPGPALQFKFALVNPAGTTTEWSNDGTSTNGNEPISAVNLPLADGLFTVMLGDTTLPGMTRGIPTTAFGNRDLHLRVWIHDTNDPGPFQLLSPDQRLGSVGYSMLAADVINGAITASKIADGSITTAKLAPGLVSAANLTNIIIDGSWLTNRLRLGSCPDCARIDLDSTDNCLPAITLDGCKSEISVFARPDGAERALVTGNGVNGGGDFFLSAANGNRTVEIHADGESGDNRGSFMVLRNRDGGRTVKIDGHEPTRNGGFIGLYRPGTTDPVIELDVADEGACGRIKTPILEITGGCDLSEKFNIKPLHDPLQPGMLVCIDRDHPGQLVTSSRAYDPTVAGIISGAGGIGVGMLMGQDGLAISGKHPVALTGRVYCMVDAEQGAIEPGDLITTSDTPGHGMKATDPTRAHGAVIGKAMTRLDTGKGLVLVLVSLQ